MAGLVTTRKTLLVLVLLGLTSLLFVQLHWNLAPIFPDPSPIQHFRQHHTHANVKPGGSNQYSTRPSMLLQEGVQYLTYLPFAGHTNQFMALEKAAYLALQLNRTLIIPPMVSTVHDHSVSHERFSTFYDLDYLSLKTGLSFVEWNDIKPMTLTQLDIGIQQASRKGIQNQHLPLMNWLSMAEEIPVEIIYGYGGSEMVKSSETSFSNQFLLALKFQGPEPRPVGSRIESVEDRKNLAIKDNWNLTDVVLMNDLVDRYKDFGGQLLFLAHTFKLKDQISKTSSWDHVGQFIKFRESLVDYAKDLVQLEVKKGQQQSTMENEPSTLTNLPRDYIAVHIRRGDIYLKCRPKNSEVSAEIDAQCAPPMESYHDAVLLAQESLEKNGQKNLPVIVATDSVDPNDFEAMERFGWYRINHQELQTVEHFGVFAPAMIDAALLANAALLVGTRVSTMTKIAASRQSAWFQHSPIYPKIPVLHPRQEDLVEEEAEVPVVPRPVWTATSRFLKR